MDTMELFTDEIICSALGGAIRCSSSESLDWHVERFGNSFLTRSFGSWGHGMPIHAAAKDGNPETLRAILRHHPYHKRKILRRSITWLGSPLHIAVKYQKFENAQFLLDNLPGIIKLRDDRGNTALHIASNLRDCRMLRMLLEVAPRNIIKAKNNYGNTILHEAAESSTSEMIVLIMRTGYFTGMERNNGGTTPVYLYGPGNHGWMPGSYSHVYAMQVFGFQSEEQVIEALQPDCCCLFLFVLARR